MPTHLAKPPSSGASAPGPTMPPGRSTSSSEKSFLRPAQAAPRPRANAYGSGQGRERMSERRSLTQGLKSTPSPLDVAAEKQFVFGRPEPGVQSQVPPSSTPISTRLRADLVAALKRASLERQLQGSEPSTLRNILEDAIEPWLRS